MLIYHFCCEKDLRGIKTDGLTKGAIPIVDVINGKQCWGLIKGWQWLTVDGRHGEQAWATNELIKDDRTEYRLTIQIVGKEVKSLYDRDQLLELLPQVDPMLFDGWEGSKSWRVFRGTIPKYWIQKIEHWENGEWKPIPWR